MCCTRLGRLQRFSLYTPVLIYYTKSTFYMLVSMEAFGDGKILVVIGKILRISYLHWNELNSDKLLCKLAKAFPRTELK